MTIASSPNGMDVKDLVGRLGSAVVNTLYPNDYEYYLVIMDLMRQRITKKGVSTFEIVDSIVFPVTPASISETLDLKPNIKKTAGGVVSLINDTFKPVPISINGTFGRRFKLMLDVTRQDLSNKNIGKIDKSTDLAKTPTEDRFGNKRKYFTVLGTTGFGYTKKLEDMCWRSTQIDSVTHKPYILRYTNLSFNTAYLVEVGNFTASQSLENNGIWFYQLQMTGVKPWKLDKLNRAQLLIGNIVSDIIQRFGYQMTKLLANVTQTGLSKI